MLVRIRVIERGLPYNSRKNTHISGWSMGRQETKTEFLAKYRYPRNQFRRGLLRSGIALASKLLIDYKVYGTENLPKKGPLLIVGNHFHFLDTIGPIHSTK